MLSCCFYSNFIPTFSADRERAMFDMALAYRLEKLIYGGIYTFNTCMRPGLDVMCTAYIAGLINTYNNMQHKENAVPQGYSRLRIHLYHIAAPADQTIESAKMTDCILNAASSVQQGSAASEIDCIKRAIKSSTCLFTVGLEDENNDCISFAKDNGLKIIRYTPDELVAAFVNGDTSS